MANEMASEGSPPDVRRPSARYRVELRPGVDLGVSDAFWTNLEGVSYGWRAAEAEFLRGTAANANERVRVGATTKEALLASLLEEVLRKALRPRHDVRVFFHGWGSIKFLIDLFGLMPPSADEIASLAAFCISDILGIGFTGSSLDSPKQNPSVEASSSTVGGWRATAQAALHFVFGSVGLAAFALAAYLLWIVKDQWSDSAAQLT